MSRMKAIGNNIGYFNYMLPVLFSVYTSWGLQCHSLATFDGCRFNCRRVENDACFKVNILQGRLHSSLAYY